LDIALLRDRRLFDCNHLALHLSELGRVLLVALDEERGWPENDNGGGRRPLIFCALAVLDTR